MVSRSDTASWRRRWDANYASLLSALPSFFRFFVPFYCVSSCHFSYTMHPYV